MNAYYKYQLHPRVKAFGLIFKVVCLFQQYIVVVFCAIEQSRLDWVCNHQNNLHSDYLLGLYDAVSRGDREGIQAGSKIMLPRTFTGGPRYMYSHYLDALDIRSSVHNIVPKRGLPHCHTHLWVDSSSKIRNAFEIDEYIFAEIPDPLEDPRGYKVVTEVTMHGPCGVANPAASGNVVELTMWDELAKQFKKDEIKRLPRPIIIVVSSCRVSKYRERIVYVCSMSFPVLGQHNGICTLEEAG
nr:DNA helicase [Tanacetum cinerariifolium]